MLYYFVADLLSLSSSLLLWSIIFCVLTTEMSVSSGRFSATVAECRNKAKIIVNFPLRLSTEFVCWWGAQKNEPEWQRARRKKFVWMLRYNCNMHRYGTFRLEIDFATINHRKCTYRQFEIQTEHTCTHIWLFRSKPTRKEGRRKERNNERKGAETAYNDLSHIYRCNADCCILLTKWISKKFVRTENV